MTDNMTEQKTNKSKSKPILYKKFDAKLLSYTENTNPDKNAKQMVKFPRYNHPTLNDINVIIQTPWIELIKFGIPSMKDSDDKDR